jgi:glycosyltransferase involved in cell wall biosynthesis
VTNLGEGSLKTGEPSLQLRNSLARWMKGLDTSRLHQRLYISATPDVPSLFGRSLPPAEDYATWVAAQLADAGMDPRRTIAWDCPVVWDYPDIAESIPFLMRVVDIIDDQRAWNVAPKYKQRLEENYEASLAKADIVFANCAPVANAFAPFASDIHTIRNGAELFDLSAESILPERLALLPRPIIGYAGNLRDRIDWGLLAETVKARPEWSFVLLGSAQSNQQARDLAAFPNVHFLGVVEYSKVIDYLRGFDVAIVPHERNKLTEHMNPLKVYNYFAAGLPIVMTGVANLEEMEPYVRVARGAPRFLEQIESALLDPPLPSEQRQRMMTEISWASRVAGMLDVIERKLAAQ